MADEICPRCESPYLMCDGPLRICRSCDLTYRLPAVGDTGWLRGVIAGEPIVSPGWTPRTVAELLAVLCAEGWCVATAPSKPGEARAYRIADGTAKGRLALDGR